MKYFPQSILLLINMFQERCLKFYLIYIYLTLKLVGLWSLNYNEKIFEFETSTRKQLLYTILVMLCIAILHLSSMNQLFSNSQILSFNETSHFVAICFIRQIFLSFCLIYIIHYLYLDKTRIILHKSIRLTQRMVKLYYRENFNFMKELFLFFLQFFVIPTVHISMTFVMLYTTSNDIKCIIILFFLGPYAILPILPNCMYGIILGTQFYFKIINCEVTTIMNKAAIIIQNNNKNVGDHKFRQMKLFCELSDSLDECMNLYRNTTDMANAFCSLFSIHNLLSSCYVFASLIFQLFLQYVFVSAAFRNSQICFKYTCWLNAIHVVLQVVTVIHLGIACSNAEKEADKKAKILYADMLMTNVDVRFRNSVTKTYN